MMGYFRSVWDCRFFWMSLVRMDLRARYRGSVLGMGWSLLNPILMSAILSIAFCAIFRQDPLDFGLYLFAGLTVWNFVVGVVQQGCLCFFQAESYIRQFPAPMAIYPLRTVLATAFHFAMGLIPVMALAAWRNGTLPSPQVIVFGVIPGVLLLLGLGWALAVLVGVANVHFRDTRHITDIALQVFFYLTPVMYPADFKQQHHRMGLIMEMNPLMPFLRLIRDTLLENRLPAAPVFGSACMMVALFGAVAVAALWNEERKLIFHL